MQIHTHTKTHLNVSALKHITFKRERGRERERERELGREREREIRAVKSAV